MNQTVSVHEFASDYARLIAIDKTQDTDLEARHKHSIAV
jgi:hypothetical protein